MINRAIIVGSIGADAELRYTNSGDAVASLSVATNRSWKDKDGNRQQETEWHRIQVWGPSAEYCGKYLKKGDKVYIEGRISTRKWQDQSGNDRYTTEIIANTVQNLSPRKEDGGRREEPPPHSGGYGGDDSVPF